MTMASKELSILLVAKDMASKTIGKVSKEVGGLGKMGRTASRGIKILGVSLAAMGAAAAVGIGAAIKTGIAELAKSEAAAAQTAAVLKSTGAAAHVTAAGIDELTASLQAKTATEDDAIRAGANMMLTFTNVRNEAGKGNDIFNQSIATLADMSRAMGGDMAKSAIQLGKALNDPIAGIGALKKVGVTFDAQQIKRIKAFVKEGKVTKAQAIILAELNKEFGGSGAAYAKTYAGTMEALGFAVEDAQKSLAIGFMPVLQKVAGFLRTQLARPEVIQGIKDLGTGLAGAFEGAMDFAMKIPWGSVIGAARGVAGAAKEIIGVFMAMPDWVKQILIGGFIANKLTGGAVSSLVGQLASGLVKGVLGINAGVVNLKAATVIGGPGGGGAGEVVKGAGVSAFLGTAAAAAAITAAATAAMYGLFYLIPSIANGGKTGTAPTIATNRNPGTVVDATWQTIASNLGLTGKPVTGGGRGDKSTADEVKRLGAGMARMDGVIERAVAKGFAPTKTGIQATLDKNARAAVSGDDRMTARIASLNSAVNSGTRASRETATAVRNIDLRPVVNVPITVVSTVSVRGMAVAQRISRSYKNPGRTRNIDRDDGP
jgi:hypothetical protein